MRTFNRAATTMVAWELVPTEYQARQEPRQPSLVSELNNTGQKPSETNTAYADRVQQLFEKLEDTDLEAADQLGANAIPRGRKTLPERGSLITMLTQHVLSGLQRDVGA